MVRRLVMNQVDRIPWSVNKTHLILIWISGITFTVNLFSAIYEGSLPDVIFVLLFFGGLWGAITLTPHLVELQKSRRLLSLRKSELDPIEDVKKSMEWMHDETERAVARIDETLARTDEVLEITEEFLGKWDAEEMTVEAAKNEGYLPDSTDN